MNADERAALGARVKKARIAARMGKEAAARKAGISAITWKRVEDGSPVHDVSLAAVLGALEPDTQLPVAPAGVQTASDDDLLAELTYRLKRYAPVGGKVVIPERPPRQGASPKQQRAPHQ